MAHVKGQPAWNKDTSQGWTDNRGYRWLYVTENGKRVARREHRVLMERHLGRKLEPWEIVHHKDENTANNTIENLEVMDFGSHTGAHSLGRRKDADARRSMEAFALMREELKRERAVKADLLAQLKIAKGHIEHMARFITSKNTGYSFKSIGEDMPGIDAAIAKAKGAA